VAAGAADYRVVSTFRVLDATGSSTAAELSARTQTSGAQYHCNWDPSNGAFSIMYSNSATDNAFLQQLFIDTTQLPGFDRRRGSRWNSRREARG
jgi:hypothetical protein